MKNSAAFDGALLRMADYRIEDGRLFVAANSTSFSAYVATRHPGFGDKYPHEARADPLGMTAIVLTADDGVIVTKRSLAADQNPGGLYLIGGYAEPAKDSDTVDLFQEVARDIAEEIAVSDLIRSASLLIGLDLMIYAEITEQGDGSRLFLSRHVSHSGLNGRAPSLSPPPRLFRDVGKIIETV